MQCQECHERPATLHFMKEINGVKTETHLCEYCAKKSEEFTGHASNFSIHDLLSGLLNFEQVNIANAAKSFEKRQQLECKHCGMTYAKFSQVGRFGCANCYTEFQPKLEPLLKRVHSGNTSHAGKIPKRLGEKLLFRKEIQKLRDEMQTYISKEEFEEAAKIRDKIRSLEKQYGDSGEE
jgi:protein arginine kinase activator